MNHQKTTDKNLIEFATSLMQNEDFMAALPPLPINPQLIIWLCWLDQSGIELECSELTKALEIVGGDNQPLLIHLINSYHSATAIERMTRVQKNLIVKHIEAAKTALERVLQQRLQDLTPRLDRSAANEDALSLFDYLAQCNLDNFGSVARQLLDIARSATAVGSDQPSEVTAV